MEVLENKMQGMLTAEQLNDILLEWSYRLPKGYPTTTHNQLGTAEEQLILSQILHERGLKPLNELITIMQEAVALQSNPTDIKEGLVCLWIDAGLLDHSIYDRYRSLLDSELDSEVRRNGISKIRTVLNRAVESYGKYYSFPDIKKIPTWTEQVLSNKTKKTSDLVLVNNAVAAADAVVDRFASLLNPGCVRRGQDYVQIRKKAVELIQADYQLKNYPPDNWCPGDLYLLIDSSKIADARQATSINLGSKSLNAQFYGSVNKKGPIIAVSLKMEGAQAGKGTTFVQTITVDGVTAEDKLGAASETKTLIKFRNTKRHLEKYYLQSDQWKTDAVAFKKVRAAIGVLQIPNVSTKLEDVGKLKTFLRGNKNIVQLAVDKINRKLSKSLDAVGTFQQAYTRFVVNLKSKNITKVNGNALEFIKSIEQFNRQKNGGKLNLVTYNELLAQKSAAYDLASTLIEKWTNKTKQISPAFAQHLSKVKNPFVAITLYAIAQHGLNPTFYRVIGKDNAEPGIVEEFPTNSQINEATSTKTLHIADSAGQAGFRVHYTLEINNRKYQTVLVFRFASSQIRVEVQKFTQVA